ncbi:hypothetical protein DLM45_13680 [Hyphomicrobium methylovorum]|uniref:hypothetical protein n=1 Tax=Hyphomicrobium methylovorum TaxID=84 RepID=UPI0015E72B12|nr:hypothetical protein [Hyphomicrobium methylovorum]MBA2127265.1 hypothetical protein [Hyphomicrobium methylovorum]
MRPILTFAAFALAFVFPFAAVAKPAKEKPQKPFTSSEELLRWINGYRHHPEPGRIPLAVKAISALGVTKDAEQSALYIGFVAGAIGANGDRASDLVEQMFPMPPENQVIIIKGIAYSGLPKWRPLLSSFVERMPARKELIQKYLYGDKPVLTALQIKDDATVMDLNWGYYFATGWEAPVRRIVAAVQYAGDKNEVETLTIGAMAKWTLAQNASRDNDLLMMIRKISADSDPKVRKPLAEVIDAAESLELSQLRKDALASIEELKAKGPENLRNYNWWGQAGQTVFALGCVAAGVMGQVEFGIPCVVGGAVSTAALKYFQPTP